MTERNKPIKLYFFGDSICFGQYVSTHKTWTTRISKFVSELCETRNFEILTQVAAVNGETTRGALMRLEHDVLAHAPDIVWVQFGLNDANYWLSDRGLPRTSLEAYVANMREICERIRACGTKRILVSTNHRITKIPNHLSENLYSKNAELYNNELRKLVRQFAYPGIDLVDMESEIAQSASTPEKYLLLDGVHLNEIGHHRYHEIASKALTAVLQDLLDEVD